MWRDHVLLLQVSHGQQNYIYIYIYIYAMFDGVDPFGFFNVFWVFCFCTFVFCKWAPLGGAT
jgi:hypothetical protein